MASRTFRNSPTRQGNTPAFIESGVISNVNVRTMTVDWVSQYSGKQITDIQMMSPYLHFTNGEGFTCLPEVGAICEVCFPSDEESPFVLGFLMGPELEGAVSGDLQTAIEDPAVEGPEDLPQPVSTGSTGSTATDGTSSGASFRGGRPVLNPGDMIWQGRDGNFILLKRGGVLQIGATQICQRAYIPLLNYIRDFCENYELNTASGSLSWTVQRQENDPSGNAPTELTLLAREFAQDAKASIKVSVGCLTDAPKPPGATQGTPYIELVIAPQSINPKDGVVTSGIKYVLRLDKVGNSFVMQTGTRTEEIGGDHSLLVKGKQSVEVKGDRSAKVGGKDSTEITGEHSITGSAGSKENWGTVKSISATVVKLGSEAASEPAVKGLKLLLWLSTHSHAGSSPPLQAGGLSSILSRKVFVE